MVNPAISPLLPLPLRPKQKKLNKRIEKEVVLIKERPKNLQKKEKKKKLRVQYTKILNNFSKQ